MVKLGDMSKGAACIKMAAAKLGWVEEIVVFHRIFYENPFTSELNINPGSISCGSFHSLDFSKETENGQSCVKLLLLSKATKAVVHAIWIGMLIYYGRGVTPKQSCSPRR